MSHGDKRSILKSHPKLTAEDKEEIRRIVTQAVAESGSRVDGIVEVTARAIEVLGAKEKPLRWLKASVRSLSAIVAQEQNFILNSRHTDFSNLRFGAPVRFYLDTRLTRKLQ